MSQLDRETLKKEIKVMIIETLTLEDITIDDIVDGDPLFNEGLGLDSIDALELGVALKRTFNINIKGDDEMRIKESFFSVDTLATFVFEKLEETK